MWIEITAPGRVSRQRIDTTIEEHQRKLLPGFVVTGKVMLCDSEGRGGFVAPTNGPSLMEALLDAYGDELLAWLKAKGVDCVTMKLEIDGSKLAASLKDAPEL